jgi:hypothetical protein
MAAQAMSVLDQEQLLAGEVITAHHLVTAERMALASAQKRMMPISRAGSKYGPTPLTGVATMDGDLIRRLSALVVLRCPGRAQMLSWYQSDTPG